MSLLKNIYFLSLVGGILSTVVSLIDSKISKVEKNKNDYLKCFIISTLISLLLLFIYDNGNSIEIISDLNEEIDIGNPGF